MPQAPAGTVAPARRFSGRIDASYRMTSFTALVRHASVAADDGIWGVTKP